MTTEAPSAPADTGTLAKKAVRGAAWTIGAGLGSRVFGLVGTLLLTYYLDPAVIGEVSAASVLTLTAGQFSTIGVGQYVIAKPQAGRDVVWHATLIHLTTGTVAILGTLLLGSSLAVLFRAPTMMLYLPGFVVQVLLDRVAFMPERLLARDMRYRVIGVARTSSDLTYTLSSVGLAVLGFGGMAIVFANVARSLVKAVFVTLAVERRAWFGPTRFSWPIVRDMLRFGVPLWLSGVAEFASRKWDNLAFAAIYGPAVMGEYNLAYNLAEIPANQVGEQIGDVLLPTFANLDLDQKRRAIVRSLGLISLIVFPLAIGLGAVAPTAVHTVLRKEWQGVWPMLAILSAMAIARPFGWTISAYLQARDRTRPTLWLESSKVMMIVGFIWAFSFVSPLWSCVGVGLAFTGNAILSMWVVERMDGVRLGAFLGRCARPLAACVPLTGAVLGTRWLLARAGIDVRGVNLGLEIVAGALGYLAGAAVFAREMARDVVRLVRNAVARRRGG